MVQLLKGSDCSNHPLLRGRESALRCEPLSHYLYKHMGSQALHLLQKHDPRGPHFLLRNQRQQTLLDLAIEKRDLEAVKWMVEIAPWPKMDRCACNVDSLINVHIPLGILECILEGPCCRKWKTCHFKETLLVKVVTLLVGEKGDYTSETFAYGWQLLQLAQKNYEHFGSQLFHPVHPWRSHFQNLASPILAAGPEWLVIDLMRLFYPNLQGRESAYLLQALLLKCPFLGALQWFCQHLASTLPLAGRPYVVGSTRYRDCNDAKLWIVKRFLPEHFALDMEQNFLGYPEPPRCLLLMRLHFASMLLPARNRHDLPRQQQMLMDSELDTVASCAINTYVWELLLAYHTAWDMISPCLHWTQNLLEYNSTHKGRSCAEVWRDKIVMQRIEAYQQAAMQDDKDKDKMDNDAAPARELHMPMRVLRARREMGMHHEFCAAVVLYADGYLKPRDDLPAILQRLPAQDHHQTNVKQVWVDLHVINRVRRAWRFLQIASRLPLVLQQLLCNRLYHASQDHMTANEMERALAYVGLFLFDEHKKHTYL